MGTPLTPSRASRASVTLNGEVIFDVEDIYAVSRALTEFNFAEAPQDAELPAADPAETPSLNFRALRDYVQVSKEKMEEGATVLQAMESLANELLTFCGASLNAWDRLTEASQRVESQFDQLDRRARNDIRRDLLITVDALSGHAKDNTYRAREVVDRLAKFSGTVQTTGTIVTSIRERCQNHMDQVEDELSVWESSQGVSSKALATEILRKLDALNKEIQEKEAARPASSPEAEDRSAPSSKPIFWLFSIPGVLCGSIAGIQQDELKKQRAQLLPLLHRLAETKKMNAMRIWFGDHNHRLATLHSSLETCQSRASNLHGQAQALSDNLGGLEQQASALRKESKDEWLATINAVREKINRKVCEELMVKIAQYQRLAFSAPRIEKEVINRAS